jgi:hypothetical protein
MVSAGLAVISDRPTESNYPIKIPGLASSRAMPGDTLLH